MAEVAHRRESRKEAKATNPTLESHKTKAIKAAEWAVRPRSAITGLGERAGSISIEQLGRNVPLVDHKCVHQGCSMLPASNRPHSASTASKAPRDIWPQDMQQKPPRFCVGCRGDHEPLHEHNPDWQPYTPLQRFDNLHMLESKFQAAFRHRELPVTLTGASQPVKWLGVTAEGKATKPHNLSEQQYKQLLPLLFDGSREGHEPYRFLASYAALDLLAVAAPSPIKASCSNGRKTPAGAKPQPLAAQATWLLDVLPDVVAAVKAGLNTMQPSLAAHMMLMLQRLLQTNSSVGPAMVPHYKQLLPVMALLMRHSSIQGRGISNRLLLPPPHCLPPVGSFTGDGKPPAGSPTCCQVCGATFSNTVRASSSRQQQLYQAQHPQEGVCGGSPLPLPCTPPLFGGDKPSVHARTVGCAIKPRRASMVSVVEETLQLMVEAGGAQGLAAVKRHMPTFDYCNPQD